MNKFFEMVGKCVIICAVVFGIFAMCSFAHTYKRPATVTHVWGDEIVCVDEQGQEWLFYGEGFTKGQNIILKMNDMETITIKDDVIYDVEG